MFYYFNNSTCFTFLGLKFGVLVPDGGATAGDLAGDRPGDKGLGDLPGDNGLGDLPGDNGLGDLPGDIPTLGDLGLTLDDASNRGGLLVRMLRCHAVSCMK